MDPRDPAGAAHASAAPELSAASTRERVSRTVLSRGPVTAAQLAVDLGITPAAVRRHLDSLAAEGLVRQAPLLTGPAGRRPGRPARGWVATDAGHAAAPGSYDDLATAALAALEREAGRPALERFARERADELVDRHRESVEAAGSTPAARALALAEALSGDGYAARTAVLGHPAPRGHGSAATAVPASVQLCQGHCPVQAVATRYPELCEAETEAFARLIGAPVRRLATLAAGHHACTTHVTTTPIGPTSSTSPTSQVGTGGRPRATRGPAAVVPPSGPSGRTSQTTQTSHATQGRSA
ncbi:transcriptional regulator [Quadrisphaera granulorum]|uniref:Transcriptional regulator n=1 Tax=Quadrisphaera granulorum TaxID=317664 RepID=A0A316A1T5_9ACTN|nr:helix-turn-helix domain-containing protein [Quadrisphaera granulorum]PWJ50664.1 transcriptional regulator [Quadrisphaera granulorum]SZE97912.1 transcriptional regulator [Quadrisphaera granulorum]